MAVISKLDFDGQDTTKWDNGTIKQFITDGKAIKGLPEGTYHFAKESEVTDGICENAVNEPIIDMQISGNSVQDGTPTPEAPIEVESVGEKTKNIADLSQAKTSTTTSHTKFNYDNKTGTLEYTSKPTAFDYGMIYLERDVGYKFEEGKTYYWGADITVSGKTTSNDTVIYFGITYTDSPTTGKIYRIKENTTFRASGSFTYNGQETIRLIMHANYNSVEPAKVKYEHIFVSEVDEFEPYGYKIPINLSGKNLFNTNYEIGSIDGDNGGVVNSTSRFRTGFIKVEPNTTYTFSCKSINNINLNNVKGYDNSQNYISTFLNLWNSQNFTFTTPSDVYYIKLLGRLSDNSIITNDVLNGITNTMLEVGDISTNYEKYIEPTTTNIYLNEPLRKVGDYADYVDYKNKKVVRNIIERKISDITKWSLLSSVSGYYRFETPVNNKLFTETESKNILCECFRTSTYSANENNTISERGNINYIRVLTDKYSTMEDFLSGVGDYKMYYVLATPTEETIDIPEISTFDGDTIISTDTEIKPSEIKVNYWKQI